MATHAGKVDLDEVVNLLRARRDAVLERWPHTASHIPELYDALLAFLRAKSPREFDRDPAIHAATEAYAYDRFERGLKSASVLADFRILRQEIDQALHDGRSTLVM